MSNLQTSDTVIEVIYNKLQTLILQLKSNDELDQFVEKMIQDLQQTLLSNTNDLRERIKQSRPHPDDQKIIVYKELLEQMISVMHQLENLIHRILDEFHILIEQLWHEISINDGKNLQTLLEEHQRRTQAFINQQWINHFDDLELKLNFFNQINSTKKTVSLVSFDSFFTE